MPVAAESELRLGVRPGLDEVRELAQRHNLVPVTQTFLEDCETPVSAFLKLRGAGGPAFLLESAEQGQRVGRWSFIGYRPRRVIRWTLADGAQTKQKGPLLPGAALSFWSGLSPRASAGQTVATALRLRAGPAQCSRCRLARSSQRAWSSG